MINRAFYCVANYGLDVVNKSSYGISLARQAPIPKSLAVTCTIKFNLLYLYFLSGAKCKWVEFDYC